MPSMLESHQRNIPGSFNFAAPSGVRSSTQTRWDLAGNIFTVNIYDNILYIYTYDYIYLLFTQFVFLTPIKQMFFLQMVH